MATTRLRRTFAYPTDADDSDNAPDLDEEHQEALLTTLQSQDEATSLLYRNLFLALPILTSLAYLPPLTRASSATETVVALLSVVVPASAAWVLWGYPVGGKEGMGSRGGKLVEVRYLIGVGAGLAGVLVLRSGVLWWAVDSEVRDLVPAGEFYSLTLMFHLLTWCHW